MEPATGPAITVDGALAVLDALGIDDAPTRFADDTLVAHAPDPGPRAGLVALSVPVAAPVLDASVDSATAVEHVGLGATASPGRIVGPPVGGSTATRVVNERYRAEVTLGMFQNGSIHHVAGKEIKIAHADTLTDDGAIGRWIEAFRRGNLCSTDVMGTVRLFEHENDPLEDGRGRFGVVPLRTGL